MAKFEVVSKYKDAGLSIPVRKTKCSAGYDFVVAEDVIVPPYEYYSRFLDSYDYFALNGMTVEEILEAPDYAVKDLQEMADFTKRSQAKPTLVPTGIKCQMADNEYLEISVRSSCPLKYWLVLANGVGIIDSDYYNNPDNEGEIFFQVINLSRTGIQLRKGDVIGQGIIKNYIVTEDDAAVGDRLGGFGSTDK